MGDLHSCATQRNLDGRSRRIGSNLKKNVIYIVEGGEVNRRCSTPDTFFPFPGIKHLRPAASVAQGRGGGGSPYVLLRGIPDQVGLHRLERDGHQGRAVEGLLEIGIAPPQRKSGRKKKCRETHLRIMK